MTDVLESVSRHKNVTNGVLRITSNNASGLIGVFCGRFITGAGFNPEWRAGLWRFEKTAFG
jgi:hypothetical protein